MKLRFKIGWRLVFTTHSYSTIENWAQEYGVYGGVSFGISFAYIRRCFVVVCRERTPSRSRSRAASARRFRPWWRAACSPRCTPEQSDNEHSTVDTSLKLRRRTYAPQTSQFSRIIAPIFVLPQLDRCQEYCHVCRLHYCR